MTAAPEDTAELAPRAPPRHAAAVDSLFQRHRPQLAQMIRFRMDPRVRARVDPSDVIQETLVAASQKMADYAATQPLPFYPWLRQIAWEKLVHLHDRHLRAAKRSVAREQGLPGRISDESAAMLGERLLATASSPSDALLRDELRERVRRALDRLPAADRELLVLRYLEQLSSRDIAAVMGLGEAAVNMRHMRALERMRKFMSGDAQEG
jgi:RNA polymerase sigma-70 factor (ECF subfamily)